MLQLNFGCAITASSEHVHAQSLRVAEPFVAAVATGTCGINGASNFRAHALLQGDPITQRPYQFSRSWWVF